MTRYVYEMYKRYVTGMSPEDAAKELGVSVKRVKIYYHDFSKMTHDIDIEAQEEINLSMDSVAAKLDPETYNRLMQMVVDRHAGA